MAGGMGCTNRQLIGSLCLPTRLSVDSWGRIFGSFLRWVTQQFQQLLSDPTYWNNLRGSLQNLWGSPCEAPRSQVGSPGLSTLDGLFRAPNDYFACYLQAPLPIDLLRLRRCNPRTTGDSPAWFFTRFAIRSEGDSIVKLFVRLTSRAMGVFGNGVYGQGA